MNIHVTLKGGEQSRSFILKGRIGQTFQHLHCAGQVGITTLQNPALRLSTYIHSLRKMGFEITTEREPHGGKYPGHHARYRLESIVLRSESDKKGKK